MSHYASVNGLQATSFSLSIPYYGAWVADVDLAPSQALSESVVLVAGNLTLRGTNLRADPFAGSNSARIVGGAGGWGLPIALAPYRNPAGVPLSLVLRDAASAVGETVRLAADRSLGEFYVPEAGPASWLLRQLAGELWWVDSAGVTQVGARPSTTIKSQTAVTEYRGGRGWLTIATEDLAAWMPKATYSGPTVTKPITVGATRISSGDDGILRIEVLAI
jgi:hypothetical protein